MGHHLRPVLFVFFLHVQTSKNQIKVDLVDENFTELRGEIAGPPDTPYEGIVLHFQMKYSNPYYLFVK